MNEGGNNLTHAQFRDIPRDVFERAVIETKRFSTVLVLDGEFVGSGTLIKWNHNHGILTAHHVVHNPKDSRRRFNFNGRQELTLQVENDRAHWPDPIELCTCQCIDIGIPVTDETGPDLSVIVLPEARLGTIKAKKEFYNLSFNTEKKLEKALCDYGFFIFAGSPAAMSKVLPGRGESDKHLLLPHGGGCTGLSRRFDAGGFDFLELNVSYHPQSEALETYQGMSGGGVWRIPLFKRQSEPVEKATFNEVVLAGVAFYQTERKGDECKIRCHGPKSIFVNTLQALNRSTS